MMTGKVASENRITPVILAGGVGLRLWPLSRAQYPKQFTCLNGEQTMLQQTAMRVSNHQEYDQPIVICNDEHRFIVAEQLREVGITPSAIILEPSARNTAPALALGALLLAQTTHDKLMLVMPSDHSIEDEDAFHDVVQTAKQAADQELIVTFGIAPTAPETGYGYIQRGDAIAGSQGCFSIKNFAEKPALETAKTYIEDPNYAWNSGMFLLSPERYLEELAIYESSVLLSVEQALEHARKDLDFIRPDAEQFMKAPSISIDHAVMERTSMAATCTADMGWRDLGAWNAMWEAAEKSAKGNAVQGDVYLKDVKDSYIRSDGPLVAALGIEDVVLVASDDAVLVGTKDRMQDLKALLVQLESDGAEELRNHPLVYRPWGSYEGVDQGARYQVKRLTVKPGGVLSLQRHQHRSEHWVVVNGTATVTKGEDTFDVHENESVYIPAQVLHRLENKQDVELNLIEVQSGSYLGEDDIERFDDAYGRVEESCQ